MADLSKTFLYRMTHIDNMPHILLHGITHISSDNANIDYKAIGDDSIISSRNNYDLPEGKKLGAFIPFYFGARMPMLYIIQNGYNNVPLIPAKDIVYCVSSVQKIIDHKLPFLFTDGHAVDRLSAFYKQNDLPNIDKILDKEAINAIYWRKDDDLDFKRRKEAEFLVEADIPVSAILGWIVYNEEVKKHLLSTGVSDKMIYVKPAFYF